MLTVLKENHHTVVNHIIYCKPYFARQYKFVECFSLSNEVFFQNIWIQGSFQLQNEIKKVAKLLYIQVYTT